MNRRRFLVALAAVAPAAGLSTFVYFAAPPPDPGRSLTMAQLAAGLAELERSAIESNFPARWRRLAYTSAIQVDRDRMAVYGVGAKEHCRAEYARLVDQFADCPILGSAFTPDGRAFCFIIAGRMSKMLQRDLRRQMHREWAVQI